MISFIVPAYNEVALIGDTIDALTAAGEALAEPYEIVVADDASEDGTGDLARERGARVVRVSHRQIAATRNSGAKHARGDRLVFVDADTHVPVETALATRDAWREGVIAGGARVRMETDSRLGALFIRFFSPVYFGLRLAAGCYLFTTRAAFESAGGFDERYYASEEIHLSRALRREGRFVVLKAPVVSSGRKFDLYSPSEIFGTMARLAAHLPRGGRGRSGLDLWYDGRR